MNKLANPLLARQYLRYAIAFFHDAYAPKLNFADGERQITACIALLRASHEIFVENPQDIPNEDYTHFVAALRNLRLHVGTSPAINQTGHVAMRRVTRADAVRIGAEPGFYLQGGMDFFVDPAMINVTSPRWRERAERFLLRHKCQLRPALVEAMKSTEAWFSREVGD